MENLFLGKNNYKVDREIGNAEGKRMRTTLVRQEGGRGWRKPFARGLMV